MMKKGQEEIVGFVAIVVLVSVVLLILLALLIRQRQPVSFQQTAEVENFLSAARGYTTECAPRFVPAYSSLGELLKECRSGINCISGENGCDVAKRDWKNLVESSWAVGEDRPVKGYLLNVSYEVNGTNGRSVEPIFLIKNGTCSGNIKGAEDLEADYPGTIVVRLSICY